MRLKNTDPRLKTIYISHQLMHSKCRNTIYYARKTSPSFVVWFISSFSIHFQSGDPLQIDLFLLRQWQERKRRRLHVPPAAKDYPRRRWPNGQGRMQCGCVKCQPRARWYPRPEYPRSAEIGRKCEWKLYFNSTSLTRSKLLTLHQVSERDVW